MSCLISSSGKQVSKEQLMNCFDRNNSAGILCLDKNNKFLMKRSWTNFDNFYEFYSKNIETPNIIFFNGKNTWEKDKAKPFILSPNLYVFIDGFVENTTKFGKHKTKSEIQLFVEQVLRPIARIDDNLFWKPFFSTLLTKSIGNNAKLIFFYQRRKPIFIYGMSSGNLEDDGHNWFSNSDYKYKYYNPPKKTYFYPRRPELDENNLCGDEMHENVDLNTETEEDKLIRLEEEEIQRELSMAFPETENNERRIKSFQELAREDIWPHDDRNYY